MIDEKSYKMEARSSKILTSWADCIFTFLRAYNSWVLLWTTCQTSPTAP